MPDHDLRVRILRSIATLSRKVRTLFDARASAYELTHARSMIFLLLAHKTSMTVAELADAMVVQRPTMVRLIDGMEANGLVRREVSHEDRRQRSISLADAAQAEVQTVQALTDRIRADVLQGIPDNDLAVTQRVIDRMLENVSKAG